MFYLVPYNKKNKANERNRSSVSLTSAVPPRSVFLCPVIKMPMERAIVHTRSRSTGRIVLQHKIITEILPISKRVINKNKSKTRERDWIIIKKIEKISGPIERIRVLSLV